jgi:hypothetical protein
MYFIVCIKVHTFCWTSSGSGYHTVCFTGCVSGTDPESVVQTLSGEMAIEMASPTLVLKAPTPLVLLPFVTTCTLHTCLSSCSVAIIGYPSLAYYSYPYIFVHTNRSLKGSISSTFDMRVNCRLILSYIIRWHNS